MTRVKVNPGVCGFPATIVVKKVGKRQFDVKIETECEKLSGLSQLLTTLDFMQVFQPVSQSNLYKMVAECSLHAACPVPVGIIKALEVEACLALPRDVSIHFERDTEK